MNRAIDVIGNPCFPFSRSGAAFARAFKKLQTHLEEFARALSKTLCSRRGGDYRVAPANRLGTMSRCVSVPATDDVFTPGDRSDPFIGHHDGFDHEHTILLDPPSVDTLILPSKDRNGSIVSQPAALQNHPAPIRRSSCCLLTAV